MAAKETKAAIPFNPAIFKWARERRRMSIEKAAERIQQTPERLLAWESGIDAPTVVQARKLADIYSRSFMEFFLPAPPDLPELEQVPDFRLHKGLELDAENVWLSDLQEWANAQRANALDLIEEISEPIPVFPKELFCDLRSDVEVAAALARQAMNLPVQTQTSMRAADKAKFPNILRRAVESIGVLTLKATDIKDYGVRGVCFAVFPLPVVVFGNEAPGAQCFTLCHELGHIMLRSSAVIAPLVSRQGQESWCDRFAAAMLMPRSYISERMGAPPAAKPPTIADHVVDTLAGELKVSNHAMLVRLVHLGYVAEGYYWAVKKPFFEAQEREYKSFGRAEYYGSRYRNAMGEFYTGLVMEAWSAGRINNHNAAEFMGIKNLQHLFDIRDRVSNT